MRLTQKMAESIACSAARLVSETAPSCARAWLGVGLGLGLGSGSGLGVASCAELRARLGPLVPRQGREQAHL